VVADRRLDFAEERRREYGADSWLNLGCIDRRELPLDRDFASEPIGQCHHLPPRVPEIAIRACGEVLAVSEKTENDIVQIVEKDTLENGPLLLTGHVVEKKQQEPSLADFEGHRADAQEDVAGYIGTRRANRAESLHGTAGRKGSHDRYRRAARGAELRSSAARRTFAHLVTSDRLARAKTENVLGIGHSKHPKEDLVGRQDLPILVEDGDQAADELQNPAYHRVPCYEGEI